MLLLICRQIFRKRVISVLEFRVCDHYCVVMKYMSSAVMLINLHFCILMSNRKTGVVNLTPFHISPQQLDILYSGQWNNKQSGQLLRLVLYTYDVIYYIFHVARLAGLLLYPMLTTELSLLSEFNFATLTPKLDILNKGPSTKPARGVTRRRDSRNILGAPRYI